MNKICLFFAIIPFISNAQTLKEGNVAIAADKMNVLYLGIDNPITFSAPAGFKMPQIEITNGQIIGEGFKRFVRPSSREDVVITVHADGKIMNYPFRVKAIPDPVFKIGSGGSRISVVEFKAQNYCRAELVNFYFDFKFDVLEANVNFSGKGFPEAQSGKIKGNSLSNIKHLIQQCVPGSIVTFDHILVQSQAGQHIIEERRFELY